MHAVGNLAPQMVASKAALTDEMQAARSEAALEYITAEYLVFWKVATKAANRVH